MKISKIGLITAVAGGLTLAAASCKNKVDVPTKTIVSRDTFYDVPVDCYIPNERTIKYVKNDSGKVVSRVIEVVREFKVPR